MKYYFQFVLSNIHVWFSTKASGPAALRPALVLLSLIYSAKEHLLRFVYFVAFGTIFVLQLALVIARDFYPYIECCSRGWFSFLYILAMLEKLIPVITVVSGYL